MAEIQENDNQNDSEVNLGVLDVLCQKFSSLSFRGTELWNQIANFSRGFEFEASELAKKRNVTNLQLWLGHNRKR